MLKCYRLSAVSAAAVDAELIAVFVYRAGGHCEPLLSDSLYWIPHRSAPMLEALWPELQPYSSPDR